MKNLNASVPGFYPLALNNDGRMVGDSLAPDDYNAYFINNGGSSGTLFDQNVEGCEGPG